MRAVWYTLLLARTALPGAADPRQAMPPVLPAGEAAAASVAPTLPPPVSGPPAAVAPPPATAAPAPAVASAQPPDAPPLANGPGHWLAPVRHFNRPHDLYVGGTTAADAGGQHVSSAGDASNSLSLGLGANVGYFVRRQLALGGKVDLGLSVGGDNTQLHSAMGPQLSVRAHLTEAAHLLPSVALLYDLSYSLSGGRKRLGSLFRIDLDAPFVFEVGAGWAVAVGPYLSQRLGEVTYDDGTFALRSLRYGISVGLLGWR